MMSMIKSAAKDKSKHVNIEKLDSSINENLSQAIKADYEIAKLKK